MREPSQPHPVCCFHQAAPISKADERRRSSDDGGAVENPVRWASYPRINCDAIEANVTHKL